MSEILPGRHVRRWLAAVLAVAAGWLHSGAFAASRELLAGVDDKWRHYRSPNFEMYSRQAETESRDMLRDLELLRTIFIERFKLVERARLEVTIYYFRSVADFRAYGADYLKKNDSFRGFYFGSPDRAVIALAPSDNPNGPRHLIFHEYIHHLFRAGEADPPVWYNEGMAELFSSIREVRKEIEIGQPQVGRLLALRGEKLLPLAQLFAVDHNSAIYRSSDHTGIFYAQSWALMHYWHFGKSGLDSNAVARFLAVAGNRKSAKAVDLRAFFNECFGMDYPEMEQRLERYVRTGSYEYARQPVPKVDLPESYQARAVSRDEIRARLADLALRMTQSAAARLVLLDAIEKNPSDARPFEVLGTHAAREKDPEEARRYWEKAIEAGSRNVAIHRELGVMESNAWFSRFDYYFRLPAETASRLRGRLHQSLQQDPQQTAGYEMLAWVEAYSDEPMNANVNLVQAQFDRLKHRDRTLIALALVRIRVGKTEEGLKLLDALEKLEPEEWSVRAAETIRARVEGRPVRSTRPGATPRPAFPTGPRPPPIQAPDLIVPGTR